MNILQRTPLGKTSDYISHYEPGLLCPVPRSLKRDELGIAPLLPFYGQDIWHAYEISWLNTQGKPQVAIGRFSFPCESPNLVESKSFKLYLNSFNQTKLMSQDELVSLLEKDLSACSGANVTVELQAVDAPVAQAFRSLDGVCLDGLDISCQHYDLHTACLKANGPAVQERLYSHLLKSNCLVTGQPDWGTVEIAYQGPQIDHAGLLEYIVSLREHHEFHEQCVERIFKDIMKYCSPESLSVYAQYTRRGGLDINPFRTTDSEEQPPGGRLLRQ